MGWPSWKALLVSSNGTSVGDGTESSEEVEVGVSVGGIGVTESSCGIRIGVGVWEGPQPTITNMKKTAIIRRIFRRSMVVSFLKLTKYLSS
jgi:hypothetical protein